MNMQRDPDAVLAAWLEDGPSRLPDVTRRAIGVATRSTDQRRRPIRAPWRLPYMNTYTRLAAAAVLVVVVGAAGLALLGPGLTGTGGSVGPGPSPSTSPAPTFSPAAIPSQAATPTASPAPTPTAASTPVPTPVAFTSALYRYRVTLPAGWSATPATVRWDGKGAPPYDDPSVDGFAGGPSLNAFGFAGSTRLALNAYADDVIARTAEFHGDTCPDPPSAVESIKVAGLPAKFIAFDCGILINIVVFVDHGTGYEFVLRDMAIDAATDPGDRSVFDAILASVKLVK